MQKRVKLPKDELPHDSQAIEWWYFNGFLNGRNKYAFMTCLFKADRDKINLSFLKLPVKNIYFSHSLLYNLTTKEIKKEVLPFVILSEDSFNTGDLKINYYYPLRKNYYNYEISRVSDKKIKLKTKFFDLMLKQNKEPLLEGGTGFIDLGPKTTYYYSYSNMDAEGFIGKEKVKGMVWHDKQWSDKGFMNDTWIWFSIQIPNNTEIVCFNYKGSKMATISYPNNRQETVEAEFEPVGDMWRSDKTKLGYNLSWKIKVKNYVIETKPIIKECEMNFGFINYWEGPIDVKVNGMKSKGFMEYLIEKKSLKLLSENKLDIMSKYHSFRERLKNI